MPFASADAFSRAWIGKERRITSILCFDELIEQVLGDLDSENCLELHGPVTDAQTYGAVDSFLRGLISLNRWLEEESVGLTDADWLDHPLWVELQWRAREITGLDQLSQYRSGRQDIDIP